jgi:hypothetical protein
VTTPVFIELLKLEAAQQGLPNLRYIVVPHPIGGMQPQAVVEKGRAAVEELLPLFTKPITAEGASDGYDPGESRQGRASLLVPLPSDPAALRREFARRGWSDGLPVIPPTPDRVEAMLEYTDRDPLDVIGVISPRQGEATVEAIAIAAVLAGCEPQMLPVLIAAVEGMTRDAFNISGVNATTHPCTVMVLVNGPIAREVGIHSSSGCFGPTFEANATIGRAMRLLQLNIGGASPGHGDRSTQGTPAKFSFCAAENEAESPWPPFQTTRGFSAEDSTVTVYACEAPHNIEDHGSNTGLGVMQTVVGSMGQAGSNNILSRGDTLLALCPEHAGLLSNDGWTRRQMQEYIFEHARFPASRVSDELLYHFNERIDPDHATFERDSMLPIAENVESVHVIVAGGPGKHSSWMPGFGNMSYPQTVAIADRNGRPVRSIEELKRSR